MKKLYKHFAVVIVMLIAVTGLSARAGNPQPPTISSPAYTLYPPTNFQGIVIEACAVYLRWDKPQDPGGLTPAGLLGYKIYRNGVFLNYLANPDILEFYDYVYDPGILIDSVTAYYDLTSYGQPGQYGEAGSPAIILTPSCGEIFPFYEPWDLASFQWQNWSFEPTQGNWTINTASGNPLPAAEFTGTPTITNYEHTLRSIAIYGSSSWNCANIYLEFDYKIDVINPTSQELMITEVYYDNAWHSKDTLKNNQSTGWTHHKVDITGSANSNFHIGFRAKGVNSIDLGEWDIDNIHIYPVCFAPSGFNLNRNGNIVHLAWGNSCTDTTSFAGYNIYRTNSTGLPPFVKLNPFLAASNVYDDSIPLTDGEYCYYITASYSDGYNHLLCESPGDTLCVLYTSGVTEHNSPGIRIFPNPVSDILNIQSDQAFTGIEVLNFLGEKVYSAANLSSKNYNIFMKDYPAGIYMVKVKSGDKSVVRKVVKN